MSDTQMHLLMSTLVGSPAFRYDQEVFVRPIYSVFCAPLSSVGGYSGRSASPGISFGVKLLNRCIADRATRHGFSPLEVVARSQGRLVAVSLRLKPHLVGTLGHGKMPSRDQTTREQICGVRWIDRTLQAFRRPPPIDLQLETQRPHCPASAAQPLDLFNLSTS